MFNFTSYIQNDGPAKTAVSGLLASRGHTVLESGRYDIDLSVRATGGTMLDVECERRSLLLWASGQPFPYATITIPERKAKFAYPGSYFVTTNATCSSFVIIEGSLVTGSSPVAKFTKTRGTERFYHVPITNCWQITGAA